MREKDDLWHLDQPVLDWLVAHRTAGWTSVLAAITFVSGPTVLPIVVGVGCLVWGLRAARVVAAACSWPAAMIASTLISLAVKGLVGRPAAARRDDGRPGRRDTASFPSGHTIGTATLLLVAGYLVCSRHPVAVARSWHGASRPSSAPLWSR